MRATRFSIRFLLVIIILSATIAHPVHAQTSAAQPTTTKTKIILDTDIGDDIDDAFALALALRSPEVELLGITTAWGDTALRARLTQRFLQENRPHFRKRAGLATLLRLSSRWPRSISFCSRLALILAKSRWWPSAR